MSARASRATTRSPKTNAILSIATPGSGETATPDTRYEDRIKRLCGRWILGKKCSKDHFRNAKGEVILWLPDKTLDTSNWVSIIMVSAGCRILDQQTFLEMRERSHVTMKWPEFGGLRTRYMQQVSPLLWAVHESLFEDGPLHMIDPYVVEVPKE